MKNLKLLDLYDYNFSDKLIWIEQFHKTHIKYNYPVIPYMTYCDRGFSDTIYFIEDNYQLKVISPFMEYWNEKLNFMTNLKLLTLSYYAYLHALKFTNGRCSIDILSMYEAMMIYSRLSNTSFKYDILLDNRENFKARFRDGVLQLKTKMEPPNIHIFVKRLMRKSFKNEYDRIRLITNLLL